MRDLILVFSHWDSTAVTASVSDNGGNAYTALGPAVNIGSNNWVQAWYAKNITGTPSGFSATYSAKTTSISLVDVVEYSGLDTSAPLDVATYKATAGTGAAMTSTTPGTSTSSYELIVGMFGVAGYGGYPHDGGHRLHAVAGRRHQLIEDMNVAATGSYTATATAANSISWGGIVVGFK